MFEIVIIPGGWQVRTQWLGQKRAVYSNKDLFACIRWVSRLNLSTSEEGEE